MKLIKPRAFAVLERKMYEVEKIDFENKIIWVSDKKQIHFIHNKFIVMQSTGFKDKNNKDIFEGDILEAGYTNPLTNKFVSQRYIVEMENGAFVGLIDRGDRLIPRLLNFIWHSDCEIIGNIYENEELYKIKINR